MNDVQELRQWCMTKALEMLSLSTSTADDKLLPNVLRVADKFYLYVVEGAVPPRDDER